MPIQETPNIKAMFEIFDPMMVPIAKASLPFRTEDIPTNISGADVPSATIVKPIVNSLNPSFLASKEELSINLSAPHTRAAKEIAKPVNDKNITHSTTVKYGYT